MKWLVTLSVSMMIFLSGCGEKKEDKVAMSQKPELLFDIVCYKSDKPHNR